MGYYRLGSPDASTGEAHFFFQGLIDPGSQYRFELFFDVNGDGQPGPGDANCEFVEVAEVTDGTWILSREFSTICSGS